MHLDASLIIDFALAHVAGELVKYMVVKIAKYVDYHHTSFLDVE